ncbi:MAG: hypothetical protein ABIO40_05675 [Devosia sp.]
MSVAILRVLIFAAIGLAVWFGARRIWRDWTGQFRAEEKEIHQRDLAERKRPDVVTLKRDKDGTFRSPDNDNRPG